MSKYSLCSPNYPKCGKIEENGGRAFALIFLYFSLICYNI